MVRCGILITAASAAYVVGATTITMTVGIAAVAAAAAVAGAALAPAALPPAHAAAGDPGTLAFKFGSHGSDFPDQIWNIRSVHVAPNGSIAIFNEGRFLDSLKVFHSNGTFSHELWGSWHGYPLHSPGGTGMSVLVRQSGDVYVFHINGSATHIGHHPNTAVASTAVAPDGSIVVGARDGDVSVYSPNFTLAFTFGQYGTYNGQFWQISAVDVAHNGNIYVYDNLLERVQVFHPNGTFAYKVPVTLGSYHGYRTFIVGPSGEFLGTGTHEFSNGTRVSGMGLYYPNGSLATVTDLDGTHWSGTHWSGFGYVDFGPTGMIVARGSSGSEVLVYHGLNSTNEWAPAPAPPRSQPPPFYAPRAPPGAAPPAPLSLAGADFSSKFGSYGSGPGQFLGPYDVAFGPGGIIAVSDYGNHRIQVFHPNGTFAFEFGSYGSADGQFAGPYGLAFGPDNQLAVFDFGNSRVQIFRIR